MGEIRGAWPEPETVPSHPELVDRAWSLVLKRESPSAAASLDPLGNEVPYDSPAAHWPVNR